MSLLFHSKLSDRLRSHIRNMVLDGDLAPDSRINEVHLAERLQVSRTPLREALTALVSEGALTSVPHKGFFVRPLSEKEFREIYPIRGLLDPEALRLSGIPSPPRIQRLRELNDRIRDVDDIEERVRLDDEWHLELIADCPNSVLLELITQFMLRTRRYELAYYRDRWNVEVAVHHHTRVIDALEDGDMKSALATLEENMATGTEPILEWLRNERASDEPSSKEADA